ncbi:MAG: hypothetical protein NVS9B4_25840 [Candidatus Acidiferrum sp.]
MKQTVDKLMALFCVACMCFVPAAARPQATFAPHAEGSAAPHFAKDGSVTQLIVGGKPCLM